MTHKEGPTRGRKQVKKALLRDDEIKATFTVATFIGLLLLGLWHFAGEDPERKVSKASEVQRQKEQARWESAKAQPVSTAAITQRYNDMVANWPAFREPAATIPDEELATSSVLIVWLSGYRCGSLSRVVQRGGDRIRVDCDQGRYSYIITSAGGLPKANLL